MLPSGRKFQKNLNIVHGFTNKVIAERKKILTEKITTSKPGSKKRLSFLDLLLEASRTNNLLTDVEIREEVDTFMFEGHDTTTAAMCWSIFLLANHQDIQVIITEQSYTLRYFLQLKVCS